MKVIWSYPFPWCRMVLKRAVMFAEVESFWGHISVCTGWFAEGKIQDTEPKWKLPQLNLSILCCRVTYTQWSSSSICDLAQKLCGREKQTQLQQHWGRLTLQAAFPRHPLSHQTWTAGGAILELDMAAAYIHYCYQRISKPDTFCVHRYVNGSICQIAHVCSSIIFGVKSVCWLCIVLIVIQGWAHSLVIHWGLVSPSSLQ